jgi:hypothetical protein
VLTDELRTTLTVYADGSAPVAPDLLERVERRGVQLRRQRRVGTAAGVVLVLIVAVALPLSVLGGGKASSLGPVAPQPAPAAAKVTVPDVYGLDAPLAAAELRGAGFVPAFASGMVVDQHPRPQAMVARGTTVQLRTKPAVDNDLNSWGFRGSVALRDSSAPAVKGGVVGLYPSTGIVAIHPLWAGRLPVSHEVVVAATWQQAGAGRPLTFGVIRVRGQTGTIVGDYDLGEPGKVQDRILTMAVPDGSATWVVAVASPTAHEIDYVTSDGIRYGGQLGSAGIGVELLLRHATSGDSVRAYESTAEAEERVHISTS